MMRTASEKLAIIRLVEDSELSVRRTLDEIRLVAPVSIAGMPLTRKVDWTALPTRAESQGVTGTGYRTWFAA